MKTKSMQTINNKLYMGSFSLEELAKKYQTPLYVYDEVGIRSKLERYKKAFQSKSFNCHTVYATKAFLAPYLCHILKEYDIYCDAVSSGDMYLLAKSGFDMSKVVLHGNNKSEKELMEALDYKVGYIVCDNISEVKDLSELCNKRKQNVKSLLRLNPGVEAHTHAFIQTAMLDSKFGESIFDNNVIEEIAKIYEESKYLEFDGFHAHIGSQITDESAYEKLVCVLGDFVLNFSKKYPSLKINTLDFGGGFAVKYLDSDQEIDLEEALGKMLKAIESLQDKAKELKIKNLMIEPGRSIVCDSGITIYETCRVKHTYAGVDYAFIDGGMNDNIRPALYQALYTVYNASQVDGEKGIYNIAGKCCESGDIIAKKVEITKPNRGDILAVFSTGAYCYSMSMNYNGLTRPGVIFVNNDKVTEVIRKETNEDLVKTYIF